MKSKEKFIIKKENLLSFKLDKETADLFNEFINYLEDEGVYMDFIWYMDDNFCEDDDEIIILHVLNKESEIKWEHIGKKKNHYIHYYQSEQITVNLENISDLYPILSTLVLKKITKLVYNFYQGPECEFMTFLVNQEMKKEIEERYKEYERRSNEEMENLEHDNFNDLDGRSEFDLDIVDYTGEFDI